MYRFIRPLDGKRYEMNFVPTMRAVPVLAHPGHFRRSVAAVFALLVALTTSSVRGEQLIVAPAEANSGTGVRRALIICGHPGDDEHRKLFAETLTALRDALIGRCRFDADNVWTLFGGEEIEGEAPVLEGIRSESTRESIALTVQALLDAVRPDDSLWVIVIGHSHYDGRRVWLNVPGPDLNEQTFPKLFDGLSCRELVFWITVPASGFYIKPLAREGRVIITATEADREVNETTFPHVLAQVLSKPQAEGFDADEDGQLTLFDLYITVARTLAKRYADDMQLSTEHAQLEDNGDGRGTEVQMDYLPEELGGRAKEGVRPAKLPNADGGRAATIPLPIRLDPPETTEQPAATAP